MADGFSNLIETLTRAQQDVNVQTLLGQVQATQQYLAGKEVRVLISDSRNFGHQSSSVNVMLRLIALGVTGKYTLALYTLDGTQDSLDALTKKMKVLLPQFQELGQEFEVSVSSEGVVSKAPAVIIDLRKTALELADFGISGGYDSDKARPLPQLNVRNYLQLQPYGWDKGTYEIVQGDETTSLAGTDLRLARRALWLPTPAVTSDDWTAIKATPWKEKAKVVRSLVDSVGTLGIHLLPVYGIGTLSDSPEYLLYNVVSGVLQAQSDYSQARKPTAVVMLQAMAEQSWFTFMNYVTAGVGPDDGKQFLQPNAAWTRFHTDQRVARRVLTLYKGVTSDGVLAELAKLDSDQVLVINLGIDDDGVVGLPSVLFSYLYGQATLPPVLEGQASVEIMLNLGKPYLKVASNVDEVAFGYPTLPIDSADSSADAGRANTLAYYGLKTSYPLYWNPTGNPYPPLRNAAMIRAFVEPGAGGETLGAYFTALGAFYHQQVDGSAVNDKLLLALNYFVNVVRPVVAEPDAQATALLWSRHPCAPSGVGEPPAPSASGAEESPLEALYASLEAQLKDGTIALLKAIPEGAFYDFFRQVVDDSLFEVTSAQLELNDDGTKISLAGQSRAIPGVTLAQLSFVFTQMQGTELLDYDLSAQFLDTTWAFPGAPWLSVSNPGLKLSIRQGRAIPVSGVLTARFTAGVSMDLELSLPSDSGWRLQGSFEPVLSLSAISQFIGGINLSALLPSQLALLTDIGIRTFRLEYDSEANVMSYFSLSAGSPAGSWALVPGVDVTELSFQIAVDAPSDLKNRTTSYTLGGKFAIGGGKAFINAQLPNLMVDGGLEEDSPPISITEVVEQYVGNQPVPEAIASAAVSRLSFNYDTSLQSFGFDMAVSLDWPITISGTTLFTIVGVGFGISGSRDTGKNADQDEAGVTRSAGWQLTGNFSGQTQILPESVAPIDLVIAASYLGEEQGWTFSGSTSNVVQLGALLQEYLGWSAGSEEYGIQELSLTIATANDSYVFKGATAGDWAVPFIPGLAVAAALELGYVGKASEAQSAGSYARLDSTVSWYGVELGVSFNYDPRVFQFEVSWESLSVTIEKPEDGPYTATFSLGDETVGSMVSRAISWATGQNYGLAAPWNVLDQLSLSAFALVFTFGDEQSGNSVRFDVGIGPLSLGFATLDELRLSYEPQGEQRGVNVELIGTFLWKDDPSEPLSWDATDPNSTPTPPGNGNEYFDLRLLALGQHVAIAMPAASSPQGLTVQDIIAGMSALHEPSGTDIPVGSLPAQPYQPAFDPDSNWLIGADFRVLRFGGEQTENGEQAESGYLLTMQFVFNDPVLYALRVALAGPAAKIFAGLDFQILYRQVSETVGVYQADLTLPLLMRRFTIGAATITLPSFGIQVYTNGDFQVDIGFPWNQDFSRSFTVEAIIPPGIPVLGSGGFYFGKLSSATSTRVPETALGTFNPVIVFGFGAQLGFGKSIEVGILSAGFSLTVLGIIEGVLAKWNPYQLTETGSSGSDQLQGQYYFWLQGTLGIAGKLYGTVDFGIVKASVNIALQVFVQITYESYADIPISVVVDVDVSVKVKINLGLFKITISLSFKTRIKETFVISNPSSAPAPWVSAGSANTLLQSGAEGVLRQPLRERLSHQTRVLAASAELAPELSNLQASGSPLPLTAYFAPGLSVAGDGASTAAQQVATYTNLLAIESVPEASDADVNAARAGALQATADTSFEALAKMVLRWLVASIQGPKTPAQVDQAIVTGAELQSLLDYLSDPDAPVPISPEQVDSFLTQQFRMTVGVLSSDVDAATYFPVAPALTLQVPDYGASYRGFSYSFKDYNEASEAYLSWLSEYFAELMVQVEEEEEQESARLAASAAGLSIGSFVFAEYFVLIGRQMLQFALDALRSFSLPIPAGQSSAQIVASINTLGQLQGSSAFSVGDLFAANPAHLLSTGKPLVIGGASYAAANGDTFSSIPAAHYQGLFSGQALAEQPDNAGSTLLLQPGASFRYQGKDFQVAVNQSLNTLVGVTKASSLADLLTNSDLLTKPGLLVPVQALLQLPSFTYTSVAGDTLERVAGLWGVSLSALADAQQAGGYPNRDVVDLFSTADDANLEIPHLSQYQVAALLDEIQRTLGLKHLSGMTSRFYLYGLRLPTQGITQKACGIFVSCTGADGQSSSCTGGSGACTAYTLPEELGLYALTGQEIALPALGSEPFAYTLSRPSDQLVWLTFAGGSTSLSISPSADDQARIDAVLGYATAHPLDTETQTLGAGPLYEEQAARYTLSNVSEWQSAGPVGLPYGTRPEGPPKLAIYQFPASLINLPNPQTRAQNPRFLPNIGRFDEASASMVDTPASYYGYVTVVGFKVRRITPVAGSPATLTTYEIIGAGGTDANTLERMVSQLGSDNAAYAGLMVGYAPNATGSARQGIQTDGSVVSMGITQVNLSTVTRPPASLRLAAAAQAEPEGLPTLFNEPTEFVRLLWEASITRNGGFFLYYYNSGSQGGLPDRIFNDRGEADLSLIALYARSSAPDADNRVANYMNGLAVGQSVASDAIVFVEAAPSATGVATAALADVALQDLAYRYFTDIASLVEANLGLPLTAGKRLQVDGGTYEVSPTGAPPGGSLAAIAAWFGTTAQALQQANPELSSWPDPLPPYTGLRLPSLSLVVGSSSGASSFGAAAAYYGANPGALAANPLNASQMGLFAAGQTLSIPGGPTLRSASVDAGSIAIKAERQKPPEPGDPSDPDYGEHYLQDVFNLLGYRVWPNQCFEASGVGLPMGPVNDNDPELASTTSGTSSKLRAPRAAEEVSEWSYDQVIAYAKTQPVTSGVPPQDNSPYREVGALLQLDFGWHDIYGNTIVSALSDPQPGDAQALNRPPLLLGYTDLLLGVAQWPGTGTSYAILSGPTLEVTLSFATDRYDPPQGDTGTASWQDNARHDLSVYQTIYYQITDPLGIAMSVDTTLVQAGSLPLGSQQAAVVGWVAAIFSFLQERALGGTSLPAPDPLLLRFALSFAALQTSSIFALELSFTITRSGGYVAGELQSTSGIRSASSSVAPVSVPLSSDPASQGTTGIDAFAQDFARYLQTESWGLVVATGSDRSELQASDQNSVWAVRIGTPAAKQSISYAVRADARGPVAKMFAPEPISNQLISRSQVPIWEYTTGTGIQFDGPPSRYVDFTDVDVNVWLSQLLAAIDAVLSPQYVVPAQIVDERQGLAQLAELLGYKEDLAGQLKTLMQPVFAGESANASELESIQEAFEQAMLERLSNAYATQAGVQYQVDVVADIAEGSEATEPPQLYGNVSGGVPTDSTLRLTSPKLELATSTAADARLLSILLSAPPNVEGSDDGALQSYIQIHPSFEASAIEHQIASVPGVSGYLASSWLSFVQVDGQQTPLSADLGTQLVPLPLRSFPSKPSLNEQSGSATFDTAVSSGAMPLSALTLWDYELDYGLEYHYPQDRLHLNVEFNIQDASAKALFAFPADAFPALAEFILIYPDVNRDLNGILAAIDAATTDQTQLSNAAVALESFNALVGRFLSALTSGGGNVLAKPRALYSAASSYELAIQEASTTVQYGEGGTETVDALLVQVFGTPPDGVGTPSVDIPGYQTKATTDYQPPPASLGAGTFNYIYLDSAGKPLSAEVGQAIRERKVVIPDLDIMERQDAWATTWMKRNEELIPGKPSAEPFVFTTGKVHFPSPLHPTLDRDEGIDIADYYTVGDQTAEPGGARQASLADHLKAFFAALLAHDSVPTLRFQLETTYGYSLNPNLSPVLLPLYLLPPTVVSVSTGGTEPTLDSVLEGLSGSIGAWFQAQPPSGTDGTLHFDLTIWSNLTSQPQPLLRLRNLYLALTDIVPALATLS